MTLSGYVSFITSNIYISATGNLLVDPDTPNVRFARDGVDQGHLLAALAELTNLHRRLGRTFASLGGIVG